MQFPVLTGSLLSLALLTQRISAGDVFAHFIVGTAAWMTPDDWTQQISQASEVGIKAFALNIALDPYTDTQLGYAYDAAEGTDFKMFISFDYAAAEGQGGFNISEVARQINAHASSSAQYLYNGKPLASTFEGPDNAPDWADIKEQTGCFFIPDYSSQGPEGAANKPNVDGLLSWEAWPYGSVDAPSSASLYQDALGDRPFMMPISPWFYTNIPNSKKWLFNSGNLWHASWLQAQERQPELIEILTWNDWGESHHIADNPRDPSAYPPDSNIYVPPTNHSGWRADLPYYIELYNGGPGSVPAADKYKPHITFWYRLSPGAACESLDVPCGQPGDPNRPQLPTSDCYVDTIFFTAFAPEGTPTVTIEMADSTQTATADGPGTFHSNISLSAFGGGLGAVTVSGTSGYTNLGTATGDLIESECGDAQYNAFVGTTA